MKTCRKCGVEKDPADFRRNRNTADGLSSWCADCHNTAKRDARRRQRVATMLDDAARYARDAASQAGWRAISSRRTAEALRRQASTELARSG